MQPLKQLPQNYAIITPTSVTNFSCTFSQAYYKIKAECKNVFCWVRWGDHGVAMKRRIDPPYVVYRNNGRQRKAVLVNVDKAPVNWQDELKQLYKW